MPLRYQCNGDVSSVCNLTDKKMGGGSLHLLRSSHPHHPLASNSILHDFRLLISSRGNENGGVGKLISEDRQHAWVSYDGGGGGLGCEMDLLAVDASSDCDKACGYPLDSGRGDIILCLLASSANGIVEGAHNGGIIYNKIWDYLYDPF